MKELSEEEKAKRYDEAIERARYWEKNPTVWSSDDICQKLFPELKESEDERIRKEITTFVKSRLAGFPECDRFIDWLESQGEHKPDDKVEPKFKVGDWVVLSTPDGEKVVQIDSIEYFKSGELRYITSEGRWFGNGTKAHLWTIKDAKTGDVLATSNYIYIFNSIDKETETVAFYCLMKKSDKHLSFGDYRIHDEIWNSIPATKEQRDTLMKAMTDAGYTFDFEKKELKKIVVPKFNVHDCVIKKHNSNINDFGSFVITDISGGKYWYNDRIICDIAEQDKWEIYEPVRQKPAWSEEDTQYINDTLALLSFGCSTHSVGEVKEWLQSLNNRVQPKQEWSEEDKRNLNDAILFIKTGTYSLDKDNLINWLKSLSPQPHWKPSDEQMKALKEAVDEHFDIDGGALWHLYEDLKKLKE